LKCIKTDKCVKHKKLHYLIYENVDLKTRYLEELFYKIRYKLSFYL